MRRKHGILSEIRGNMKYLLKFVKPYIKTVLFLMLLYAAETFCALFMPYVMSNIVEKGIRAQDLNYVYKEGAIMVALSVGALGCAQSRSF